AKKRKKRLAFFQSLIGLNEQEDRIAGGADQHPGVQLEDKERAKVLFAAIDRLPEKQRVAFTLHKLEGLSYKEITEIMEVSLASVESLLFRAKQNLKKRLRTYYEKNMI
ncbi:MAG: sigma-70 family RNA polymerase sigma factor, partial [Bacteroidota bacterium]